MICAGCNAVEGPAQVLVDGTKVCTSCPAWARECLARHMLSGWPRSEITDHLDMLRKRSPAEADALRQVLNACQAARRAGR